MATEETTHRTRACIEHTTFLIVCVEKTLFFWNVQLRSIYSRRVINCVNVCGDELLEISMVYIFNRNNNADGYVARRLRSYAGGSKSLPGER